MAFPASDSDIIHVPCQLCIAGTLTLAHRSIVRAVKRNACACVPETLFTKKIAELFNHFGYLLLFGFPYFSVYYRFGNVYSRACFVFVHQKFMRFFSNSSTDMFLRKYLNKTSFTRSYSSVNSSSSILSKAIDFGTSFHSLRSIE